MDEHGIDYYDATTYDFKVPASCIRDPSLFPLDRTRKNLLGTSPESDAVGCSLALRRGPVSRRPQVAEALRKAASWRKPGPPGVRGPADRPVLPPTLRSGALAGRPAHYEGTVGREEGISP